MTDIINPVVSWCEAEAEALRQKIRIIESQMVRYHSQSGSEFSDITEDMLVDARRSLAFVESLLNHFGPSTNRISSLDE